MDRGEDVSNTMKREFGEEALNSLEATSQEKKRIKLDIEKLFQNGVDVSVCYLWCLYCLYYREWWMEVKRFRLH